MLPHPAQPLHHKTLSGRDLTPHSSHPLGGSAPRRLPQRLNPVGPVDRPKHPTQRLTKGFPTRPSPFTERLFGANLTPSSLASTRRLGDLASTYTSQPLGLPNLAPLAPVGQCLIASLLDRLRRLVPRDRGPPEIRLVGHVTGERGVVAEHDVLDHWLPGPHRLADVPEVPPREVGLGT